MAAPKVFISSTCYDLGQIRDSLSEFIVSYCFEPTLSEKGDVFYHPDLHTHESCVIEIDNCQLFILIIGGRFGGSYIYDVTKSITNAEYEAAVQKKIPVFTFIKKDVFDDHRLYQKNRHNKDLISQIDFPSIENQEYAIQIFEFINRVRSADVNNGFFSFEFVRDIKAFLGKQWAGMFYDFLNERKRINSQKVVNATLDSLALINKKTEELLENIVKKLNPEGEGQKQIEDIDRILEGAKFYKHILRMFFINDFRASSQVLASIEPNNRTWYEYLSDFPGFELKVRNENEASIYKTRMSITLFGDNFWSVVTADDIYPEKVTKAKELYQNILPLNASERLRALNYAMSTDE